jgi:hypothetical protein
VTDRLGAKVTAGSGSSIGRADLEGLLGLHDNVTWIEICFKTMLQGEIWEAVC